MPTVSAIIPNFNHSSFLHKRINSVLNQTYQDFELIILDDCSTDNSKEIIENYRLHPKISHIVFNEQNSASTFKQWKRGVQLATGRFIWIAESDDWADSNFLITMIEKIQDETVSLAYCRTLSVIHDTKPALYKWGEAIEPGIWDRDQYFKGSLFIHSFLKYRNAIPNASAVLFRKEYISELEQILEMRFAGDWFFWILLAGKGNVAYSCKTLNYFRRHEASTRSVKSFKEEIIRINEYFMSINVANMFLGRRLHAFDKEYNWIIDQWFDRMKVFGVMQSITPPYPFLFLLRFYSRLLVTKFPFFCF